MSVIVLLIAAGGVVAGGFLLAFVWAVKSGQFDDTTTPPVRMLLEAHPPSPFARDARGCGGQAPRIELPAPEGPGSGPMAPPMHSVSRASRPGAHASEEPHDR